MFAEGIAIEEPAAEEGGYKVLYANTLAAHEAENGPMEAFACEREALEFLGFGVFVEHGHIVIMSSVPPRKVVKRIFDHIQKKQG